MISSWSRDSEKHLSKHGVTFLRNKNYDSTEMFDSVKIGIEYLKDICDAFFFSPVDVPFFMDSTLRGMLSCKGEIVIPSCKGRTGHPVLIDSSRADEILSYMGEGGLRGALDTMKEFIVNIDITDEGSFIDADTPEDYERLVELHNSNLMRPEIKLTLSGAKGFFGPGTMTLLKQIDRLGNVREACLKTGISYSKGWQIIRSLEEGLNVRLVDRTQGGKHGGSAALTDECRAWMRLYDDLEKDVTAYAEKRFKKYREGL